MTKRLEEYWNMLLNIHYQHTYNKKVCQGINSHYNSNLTETVNTNSNNICKKYNDLHFTDTTLLNCLVLVIKQSLKAHSCLLAAVFNHNKGSNNEASKMLI